MTVYRFVKTEVESVSMLKGESSWYGISDDTGSTLMCCHVIGNCLGGATTFHADREQEEARFRMEPKKKLMNMTYFVSDGDAGSRLATINLFPSRGMKVCDVGDDEVFRVVDARAGLDKVMTDALAGACTDYRIVVGDQPVGVIEPRTRPKPAEAPAGNPVRKFLRSVLGSVASDWCMELHDETQSPDRRVLFATVILLLEQTVRMDRSN